MQKPRSSVEIPACAWSRPLGLGWEKPYTVRYTSNLDDGPWHGMPLGGFGAGCIGRSSVESDHVRFYLHQFEI
ncbi:MAG TPA: hypothetical protein V6D34_19185 [Candidatus Sericytochromatia bacterium]